MRGRSSVDSATLDVKEENEMVMPQVPTPFFSSTKSMSVASLFKVFIVKKKRSGADVDQG